MILDNINYNISFQVKNTPFNSIGPNSNPIRCVQFGLDRAWSFMPKSRFEKAQIHLSPQICSILMCSCVSNKSMDLIRTSTQMRNANLLKKNIYIYKISRSK